MRPEAITAVTKNPQGEVTAITLAEDEQFALYHCKEDEAMYSETVDEAGVVTHELSLTFERMDAGSSKAVAELLAASHESGVAAIVRTNNDTAIFVGWSDRFAARYPLRMVAATGISGRKLSDVSSEALTLRSVDTDKALPYVGTIPA